MQLQIKKEKKKLAPIISCNVLLSNNFLFIEFRAIQAPHSSLLPRPHTFLFLFLF